MQNHILVVLGLFLLAGMVLGVFYIRYGDADFLQQLDFIFYSNYAQRAEQPGISVFCASLASSFLFVLVCFLCGLSIWGMALIPFVLLFRGFGLGLTGGHLLLTYGMRGFLFYFTIILPGAFLCFIGILLAAKEGIGASRKLAMNNELLLKNYLIHFGMILGIQFAAAAIDWGAAVCFAGFFSF